MRVLTIVGAAAVAAVVLAGCGKANESGSPVPGQQNQQNQPADAPAKNDKTDKAGGLDNIVEASRKAGTAKIASSIEAEVDGKKLTLSTGEGAVDFANKRSKMSTKMMAPGTEEPGTGMNVIIDGGTGYLQYLIPGQPSAPWMKFDVTAMVGQKGVADMGSYLSIMAGVTKSSEVGKENVRGVDTTHHKVTVDPKKIAEKYPEMKEFIASMMKMAENVAPGSTKGVEEEANKPVEYDLWVDKAGQVARIVQEFKTQGEDGKDVTGRSTTEFYDYGKEVEIAAPPADQIKSGG